MVEEQTGTEMLSEEQGKKYKNAGDQFG